MSQSLFSHHGFEISSFFIVVSQDTVPYGIKIKKYQYPCRSQAEKWPERNLAASVHFFSQQLPQHIHPRRKHTHSKCIPTQSPAQQKTGQRRQLHIPATKGPGPKQCQAQQKPADAHKPQQALPEQNTHMPGALLPLPHTPPQSPANRNFAPSSQQRIIQTGCPPAAARWESALCGIHPGDNHQKYKYPHHSRCPQYFHDFQSLISFDLPSHPFRFSIFTYIVIFAYCSPYSTSALSLLDCLVLRIPNPCVYCFSFSL